MVKYVIHACPKRMWYVEDYLVPSLKEQGIENIDIRCDKFNRGNLDQCMQIFSVMLDDGGAWHIQDDVIICRDFKKRTEELASDSVVCGFVCDNDEHLKYVGATLPKNMWWSFPCVYIPNHMAMECSEWFYQRARYNERYTSFLASKQFDDYFFIEFLKNYYPDKEIIQVKPCLVDHIDFMIGGTTVRQKQVDKQCRAAWFEDLDLIDKLDKRMKEDGHG